MKNTNGYQFSYNMNVDELRKLLFEYVTRTDNPHKVSPADIGLGNVDNTADKDKPLSDVGKAYIDKLYVTGIKMVRAQQTETKLNKGGKESEEYTICEVTVSLLNGNGDAVSSDKILIDNVAHDFQGRAFISDYANNLEITNKGDIRLLSPDGTILSQGSFPPAIENVTFEIENNKCELAFHFYGGTTLKCSLNTLLEYLKSDYVSKAEFVEFKDDVKIKFTTIKEDIDNLRKQVAQGFTDLDKIIKELRTDLTNKINVDINDLRDELHSEIEHVEQDANIHLNQAKAELLETIDSAKADMNVEVSKAAHNLTMTANEQLSEYTFTLLDKKGNSLSTFTINLPIESVVVKAEYLAGTREIQLTLQNGSTVKFSVADLVAGLAKQIDLQAEINDRIQNIQAVRDEIAAIKVELNKFVDEKDLAIVAFTGSYNDLNDKPDNIGRVADVVVNGDSVLNPVTKVAQIQLKTINGEAISGNGDIKVKQDLITLKTINGQSLFGEGNIQIDPETVHIKTINGKSIVGDGDVTDLYAAQDGINLTQGIFTIDFSKVASKDDIKNFVTLTTVNDLIKNFITADDVDTKLLPYAKLNDIPTVNYPVIDIKVDGESVVTDKVAEINLPKEFNLTPNSIVEVSETEKHTFDNYINTKAQALIDLNHLDNDEVEALMQELGI